MQAYALTHYIEKLGYSAEQVRFQKHNIVEDHLTLNILYSKIKRKADNMINQITAKRIYKDIELRNKAFESFEASIPHSEYIYTRENIIESITEYGMFITGSDQVWNLSWYNPEYFLNFVPNDIRKISYAASMPSSDISEEQRTIIHNHLIRLNAVSVREAKTADIVNDLLGCDTAQLVLDPTLLLDKSDWDKICSEKYIEGKYIFCYFLGKNKNMRKIAGKFAKKLNLRIVTMPHLCGINYSDRHFGDIPIYDALPNDFISLIKNAEYVLTDSFHAAVFSNIYKVKYFVFSRNEFGNMNSRITTLLNLFKSQERFCTQKETANVKYLLKLSNRELPETTPEFDRMKKQSIEFLRKNLEMS